MSKLFGVILIILGLISIFVPVTASVAISVMLGWLFIIGGIIEIIYAFTGGRFLVNLVIGGLTLVAGMIMVFSPLSGALTLTWLLVLWCFIRGIMQIITAFQLTAGRIWQLAAGVLSVLLALMIWGNWPSAAVWALGILVGINLISAGVVILIASPAKAA